MCILIIIIHNYYLLALPIFKYSKFRAKHITLADRDASHLGIYDQYHKICLFSQKQMSKVDFQKGENSKTQNRFRALIL